MIKLWQRIKEFFMKATRFILNTDYATSQNDNEFTLSVTIPSTFSVAAGEIRRFTSSKTIVGSSSKDYRCHITTSVHNYSITGCLEGSLAFGDSNLNIAIERAKDKFTLAVYNPAPVSAKTYSATSRVVTAHIMTFVDPFQL